MALDLNFLLHYLVGFLLFLALKGLTTTTIFVAGFELFLILFNNAELAVQTWCFTGV